MNSILSNLKYNSSQNFMHLYFFLHIFSFKYREFFSSRICILRLEKPKRNINIIIIFCHRKKCMFGRKTETIYMFFFCYENERKIRKIVSHEKRHQIVYFFNYSKVYLLRFFVQKFT